MADVTYVVTVPNGTAGGFYINGVQKPSLTLERNYVYTFYQSNSSNSSHPLRFSIDNSTIFTGYGTEISVVGTPGSEGAYTRITPNIVPSTIYYICGTHSGMGGTISFKLSVIEVPTAAVSSQLISAQPTTNTPLIDPIFSSIYRVSSNIAISQNFNINNLDSPVTGNKSSVPGLLTGRRPKYGQLFPRGYYNR